MSEKEKPIDRDVQAKIDEAQQLIRDALGSSFVGVVVDPDEAMRRTVATYLRLLIGLVEDGRVHMFSTSFDGKNLDSTIAYGKDDPLVMVNTNATKTKGERG